MIDTSLKGRYAADWTATPEISSERYRISYLSFVLRYFSVLLCPVVAGGGPRPNSTERAVPLQS